MSEPPATQTMLPLLEHMLNTAVGTGRQDKRFRLDRISLSPTSILLELGYSRHAAVSKGAYRLELVIRESTAAETLCEPRWSQEPGLARLLGLGARLVPETLLNEVLKRLLGDWVRVQDSSVIIDHAGLVAALARKG
ncbi:MAG: hypothetical protein O7A08_08050 [SAR324 cluster bacterium]|nr:hypothetical protein [SAR324 cluster bacterium]MCZ6729255.1 hypothetical protein [SAR324 cluster bacterium]MCZ6843776.1 hypothetical protein [SAR324 cluster bacterium]